jgi:hypothetical protein
LCFNFFSIGGSTSDQSEKNEVCIRQLWSYYSTSGGRYVYMTNNHPSCGGKVINLTIFYSIFQIYYWWRPFIVYFLRINEPFLMVFMISPSILYCSGYSTPTDSCVYEGVNKFLQVFINDHFFISRLFCVCCGGNWRIWRYNYS